MQAPGKPAENNSFTRREAESQTNSTKIESTRSLTHEDIQSGICLCLYKHGGSAYPQNRQAAAEAINLSDFYQSTLDISGVLFDARIKMPAFCYHRESNKGEYVYEPNADDRINRISSIVFGCQRLLLDDASGIAIAVCVGLSGRQPRCSHQARHCRAYSGDWLRCFGVVCIGQNRS